MKFKLVLFFLLLVSSTLMAQKTRFEQSNGKESAAYNEGLQWWESYANQQPNVSFLEYGETDAGYPLHLVVLNNRKTSLIDLSKTDKAILLINNAIHPGEPDGVDASMLLFKEINKQWFHKELLEKCIVVCIPYYNIGGALNRNSFSRANQKGPAHYGFRGNAQNLDLNRDFIKCDSKNALSFAKLLQAIDPDVYVETHVSNGADYTYTMTYLATQPDKLGFGMGRYLREKIIPKLKDDMYNLDEEIVPYINHHSGPLKDKIYTFYDSPRYSTGLTTLHQSFGFITETHMLKNFRERVWATQKFLLTLFKFTGNNAKEIQQKRKSAKQQVIKENNFPLDWITDTIAYKTIKFKGYEYAYKASKVTSGQRFFYDKTKPKLIDLKYYYKMRAKASVTKPNAYILKQGFWQVRERLIANGVKMYPLAKDSIVEVVQYRIKDYKTAKKPYEKHYYHSKTNYESEKRKIKFLKGDLIIPMNTDKNRFIIEVLEPNAPDSYFNWNFFDAILQQKEWYSNYVFEDKAEQILANNPTIKAAFELKKEKDSSFAQNPQAQLYWIYKKSAHYEKEHMELPVFRIE